MKNKLFSFLMILCCSALISQTPIYKNGVSFKTLFVDYQSQNGGNITSFKDYHHGFEIGYQTRIAKKLNLNIPFKFGNVQEYSTRLNAPDKCLHKQFGGLDAQLQYHFYNGMNKIVPYAMAGIGGVYEFDGNNFNAQVPFGVGVNFMAAKNAYINLQAEYRYALAENRNNLQYGLGFVYLFGGEGDMPIEEVKEEMKKNKDKDGDGIDDNMDLCPDVAGLKSLKGCPDSDNDGVADFQDACPNEAGTKVLKGCPDTDNDGVPNNEDQCPNEAGPSGNKGCPFKIVDTDNDGVPDTEDKCPDFPGTKENNGCPKTSLPDRDKDGIEDKIDRCPDAIGLQSLNGCPDKDNDGVADPDDACPNFAGLKIYNGCPDSDGDGLDDSIDKCPNTPGTVASNGCPDIAVEDKKTLDIAMRSVQFETGKATLKSESFTVLNQISNILSRYPDYNLAISGHTDNVGNPSNNQSLSEKRAEACYNYLITRGLDASRLSHAGFGDSRPVADNNTPNGKALNRRVEFNLVPR